MTTETFDLEFKADAVEDSGEFSGFASVFGGVDSFKDTIASGAFTKSLKAFSATPEGNCLPKREGLSAGFSCYPQRYPETKNGPDFLTRFLRNSLKRMVPRGGIEPPTP